MIITPGWSKLSVFSIRACLFKTWNTLLTHRLDKIRFIFRNPLLGFTISIPLDFNMRYLITWIIVQVYNKICIQNMYKNVHFLQVMEYQEYKNNNGEVTRHSKTYTFRHLKGNIVSMRLSSVAVLKDTTQPCRVNMCVERICIQWYWALL